MFSVCACACACACVCVCVCVCGHLTQALGLIAFVAQLATWLLLRVDFVAWPGTGCGVGCGLTIGLVGWPVGEG